MDEMLTKLAEAARMQRQVAMVEQTDGTVLLAYPLEGAVAIGIGTGSGLERRMRGILRKRAERLPRYGRWLPALFNDGSCFLIMRVGDAYEGSTVIDMELANAALELLS